MQCHYISCWRYCSFWRACCTQFVAKHRWICIAAIMNSQKVVVARVFQCVVNVECFKCNCNYFIMGESYCYLAVMVVIIILWIVWWRYCCSCFRYLLKWRFTVNCDRVWKEFLNYYGFINSKYLIDLNASHEYSSLIFYYLYIYCPKYHKTAYF